MGTGSPEPVANVRRGDTGCPEPQKQHARKKTPARDRPRAGVEGFRRSDRTPAGQLPLVTATASGFGAAGLTAVAVAASKRTVSV